MDTFQFKFYYWGIKIEVKENKWPKSEEALKIE